MSRLIIKRIQAMRKESGFEITDRISVEIEEQADLRKAVEAFGEHIASQVLANSLTMGDAAEGIETDFGDFKAKVRIVKS